MSNTIANIGANPVTNSHLGAGESFHVTPTYRESMAIAAERAARPGGGFQSAENSRHRLTGFDVGRATLKPAQRAYIRAAVLRDACTMGARPRFWICGYASRAGGSHANQALAHRRAEAVARYVRQLVPDADVRITAAGEDRPYAPGALDGSEHAVDRAVEIGVARADLDTARVSRPGKIISADVRKGIEKIFERLQPEAALTFGLRGVDLPTVQSIRNAARGAAPGIRKKMDAYILKQAWPEVHAKYPELDPKTLHGLFALWMQGPRR